MLEEPKTASDSSELEQVFGGFQYHTEMLSRAYREARTAFGFEAVEEQRDELASRVHKLDLKNQKLKLQLDETARRLESQSNRARRRRFLVWALSLFVVISFGVGINYVTSDNQAAHTPGSIMIALAIVLELLSFWIARLWRD